jgi:hypothetical protein
MPPIWKDAPFSCTTASARVERNSEAEVIRLSKLIVAAAGPSRRTRRTSPLASSKSMLELVLTWAVKAAGLINQSAGAAIPETGPKQIINAVNQRVAEGQVCCMGPNESSDHAEIGRPSKAQYASYPTIS